MKQNRINIKLFTLALCCNIATTCFAIRDPTQPKIYVVTENKLSAKLIVKMIKYRNQTDAITNINGKLGRVNDKIDGSMIVGIKPQWVVISKGNNKAPTIAPISASYSITKTEEERHENSK